MNLYKHLLAFDLSSYGAALAIINQFADDDAVKIFEISPCGTSAVLLLVAQEINVLTLVKTEAESIFKSQILSSAIIENIHSDLLPTYLSQNKTPLKKSLVILEGNFVALGLSLSDRALKENHSVVDFRIVRTGPKNVIITIGAEKLDDLVNLNLIGFKKTTIENIQPSLKSFYEI